MCRFAKRVGGGGFCDLWGLGCFGLQAPWLLGLWPTGYPHFSTGYPHFSTGLFSHLFIYLSLLLKKINKNIYIEGKKVVFVRPQVWY